MLGCELVKLPRQQAESILGAVVVSPILYGPHRERKLAITLLAVVKGESDKIPVNVWFKGDLFIPEHVVAAQTRLRNVGLGMPVNKSYRFWHMHAEEFLDLLRYQDGVNRAKEVVSERYPDGVKSWPDP